MTTSSSPLLPTPDAGQPAFAWLRAFWPAPVRVDGRERLRVVLGAAVGILLTGVSCHLAGGSAVTALPWLVAPMGASAVLVSAVPASPMAQEAWLLLRERKIKALPVVDRVFRVVGILTLADFMRAAELDLHDGFEAKLRGLIRPSGKSHTDKPEVVGQIMSRRVRVASEHRSLMELVPLFGSTGHHHIPIIGERERLVGIITQSDVVAALSQSETPAPG